MNIIKLLIAFTFYLVMAKKSDAQLKFLLEDFEGLAKGDLAIADQGIFTFGSATHYIDNYQTTGAGYSGNRAIKLGWDNTESYGGFGKGISMFVELNPKEDYLNFFVFNPKSNKRKEEVKIIIEEDDNNNGKFDNLSDDSWYYNLMIPTSDEWQLVSVPLYLFKDGNVGGDSKFNVNHQQGKLLTFIVSFLNSDTPKKDEYWLFDFICFSQGKLPHGNTILDLPKNEIDNNCKLGAWCDVGKTGDLAAIPIKFESYFEKGSNRLNIVHFFQPFSVAEGVLKSNLLSSSELNKLIDKGYTPLITLENRFVNVNDSYRQPNLKNILDGHFDYLFTKWAQSVKQVHGDVWIRILHEFNGDWYPWSVANNDKNAGEYVQTFRHINNIFKQEGAQNAKFVWCPNSMSIPQESWNYIMDAYPGEDYVDIIGLDIYNGAGEESKPVWRSFRKEATQNYFLLSKNLPRKPIIICEVASRERSWENPDDFQTKADWIKQMSEALQSDMIKFSALVWFDEKDQFKINSSEGAFKSFNDYVWMKSHFGK